MYLFGQIKILNGERYKIEPKLFIFHGLTEVLANGHQILFYASNIRYIVIIVLIVYNII